MSKFNELIYTLRKERGFTQEEIAQEINVTRQTISNWETGSAQPTIDKAIDLANLYDVSMDELIGRQPTVRKKTSTLLLSLLNQKVTIYLSPDTDAWIHIGKTTLTNCKITVVSPNSIRVILTEKNQVIEKLIFTKNIVGIEKGEN
ncbi:helix-turn-helix domain-containing protein [Enterococcus sp. LJL51]|uniref:helix-turn-helix domain-containing protein n=1 Tax=Enterococcus sp. LJL51 TaxID=3416656 RepID=UPI003CEBD929